ncbi:hypothetical protein K3495_g11631 [Podosphaera aphanis]|nr:hypothetical protein K3495_g11631 [Podosphaera aphanis]
MKEIEEAKNEKKDPTSPLILESQPAPAPAPDNKPKIQDFSKAPSSDNPSLSVHLHMETREGRPQITDKLSESSRQCNFSRVPSPCSDYGGDEFEGEVWEELTALC